MVGHHDCKMTGCKKRIPGNLAFCLYHWSMVSKTTKAGFFQSKAAWKRGVLSYNVHEGWIEQARQDIALQMREAA